MNKQWLYQAKVTKVVDGDTIDVDIDVGFKIKVHKRLRLLEVDTDELRGGTTETKARAQEAKQYVIDALIKDEPIWVETIMDSTGKYGRLLARVHYKKGGEVRNLNEELFEKYQKQ